MAETGFGRFVFLIKFTVNRYGKQLRAKLFLLPPLATSEKDNARLKQLDKRYRTNYNMSMIENLNNIQKLGLKGFLILE